MIEASKEFTDSILQVKTSPIGKTFTRWTVIGLSGDRKRQWICRCECGVVRNVNKSNLIKGLTKSCNCLKEETRANRIVHGFSRRGKKRSEYGTWGRMIQRCENENNPKYEDYGGRGISVCEKWRTSFAEFMNDMGPKPSPEHSIDRINNDGNYEPGNCRWATLSQQSGNKRNNVMLTYRGETLPRHEMAKKYGIKYFTLRARLVYGITVEEAIERPVKLCVRRPRRTNSELIRLGLK